jgi:putative transcriptional regulator
MNFKCRLKVILAEREINQEELLKEMEKRGKKISRSTLSQLVNNKTLPMFDTAYVISESLGLKMEDVWEKVETKRDHFGI